MVQVIEVPGILGSSGLGGFGSALGEALGMRAKQQKQQQTQEARGILEQALSEGERDPFKLIQLAKNAGIDEKSFLKAYELSKPNILDQFLQKKEGGMDNLSSTTDLEERENLVLDNQELTEKLAQMPDDLVYSLRASNDPNERNFGQAVFDLKKEANKNANEERKFHTSVTDEMEKDLRSERQLVDDQERTLRNMKIGMQSGDVGFMSQNWWAEQMGPAFEGFLTSGGALSKQAIKEQLVTGFKGIPAKGINVFIEKTVASATPSLMKSANANRIIMEALDENVQLKKADVEAKEEVRKQQLKEYGYLRRGWDEEAKELAKEKKEIIGMRTAYKLQSIIESEQSQDELKRVAKQKVSKGTPMTKRNMKVFKEVYGNDARAMAKKLGYSIYTQSEIDKL